MALHSPNTIVYPVVFYATTTVGATVTTLSPLATPEEMAKQLVDSRPGLLVSVSALLGPARAAAGLVRERTGATAASGKILRRQLRGREPARD